MDVLAVREATKFARDFISKGNGPIILGRVTYRFYPHSMVDPDTTYRPHEEIVRMRRTKDPIKLLKDKLIASALAISLCYCAFFTFLDRPCLNLKPASLLLMFFNFCRSCKRL